jgi:hypothetical protein
MAQPIACPHSQRLVLAKIRELVQHQAGLQSAGRPHETFRRSRDFSRRCIGLLSRQRNDGIDQQLRARAISRLQSKDFRTMRGRLQEVRSWCYDHLHDILHTKRRTLGKSVLIS